MHPVLNLSDYKATATIDWLDIAVTLSRSTQFQYVQAELRELLGLDALGTAIHVKARDVERRTDAATAFIFRLQEQHHDNNAAKITHVLHGLAAKFGFTAPAKITGIEVAFDLRPKQDPLAVYEASRALQHGLAAYGEHARQYAPSAKGKGRTTPLTLDPLYERSGSLYVGHQDAQHGYAPTSISQRVYPKITDGIDDNDRPLALPPDQHRARAEVTLQGEALTEYGITDPLALASYDFTRLAELLHFRTLKPIGAIQARHRAMLAQELRKAINTSKATHIPTPQRALEKLRWRVRFSPAKAPALASIHRNTDRVIDWHSGWDGSEGRARQHSKDTVPDAELNRKVKVALTALSKRLAKGTYAQPSSR